MRIIITGGTGFIGKAIVELAIQRQHHVAVLVRPDSNIQNLSSNKRITFFAYKDITDKSLHEKIKVWSPDAMLHIGWKGVSGEYRDQPYQFIENIQFALNTVLMAANVGCKKWIGAGSQAEYGIHEGIIYEDTVCKPFTAYGKAKLATSIAALGMCQVLGMEGAWGRIFSTYGPGDNPNYFIPFVIKALYEKQSPIVTACEQLWDYLYVTDAAAAFLHAAESNLRGAFNIGSGKTILLKKVVDQIKELLDVDLEISYGARPYSNNQIMHLQADISKLSSTGWTPSTNLLEGLEKTIKYQIENYETNGLLS